MPWANNSEIHSLRMKYNAAVTAHQGRSRALSEAAMGGVTPSHDLVDAAKKAQLELEDARAKLLAAMTKAINGTAAFDPPSDA